MAVLGRPLDRSRAVSDQPLGKQPGENVGVAVTRGPVAGGLGASFRAVVVQPLDDLLRWLVGKLIGEGVGFVRETLEISRGVLFRHPRKVQTPRWYEAKTSSNIRVGNLPLLVVDFATAQF